MRDTGRNFVYATRLGTSVTSAANLTPDVGQNWCSLHIRSKSLTPQCIVADLGLQPDEVHRMGDLRNPRRPKNSAIHEAHSCVFESTLPESASLELQMQNVLDRMEPRLPQLRLLAEKGCEMVLRCGMAPDGCNAFLQLSADLISRLSRYNLLLAVAIYCPESEDAS